MGGAIIGILVVGAVVAAFLAYQQSQTREQAAPILSDDPEMADARATAASTIGEFRKLYAENQNSSRVKVPVTSSSGVREWMVGDVVALTEFNVTVQLHGRPATHRGSFDPVQAFPVKEIADWLVLTRDGKYRGGFTQRVHFERMRKAGTLVGAEAEEAARFD